MFKSLYTFKLCLILHALIENKGFLLVIFFWLLREQQRWLIIFWNKLLIFDSYIEMPGDVRREVMEVSKLNVSNGSLDLSKGLVMVDRNHKRKTIFHESKNTLFSIHVSVLKCYPCYILKGRSIITDHIGSSSEIICINHSREINRILHIFFLCLSESCEYSKISRFMIYPG